MRERARVPSGRRASFASLRGLRGSRERNSAASSRASSSLRQWGPGVIGALAVGGSARRSHLQCLRRAGAVALRGAPSGISSLPSLRGRQPRRRDPCCCHRMTTPRAVRSRSRKKAWNSRCSVGRRGSGWAERGPPCGHGLRAAGPLPGVNLSQEIVCCSGGVGARTMEYPVQLSGGVDRQAARTAMNPVSSLQRGPFKRQCSQLAKPIFQCLSPRCGADVGQWGGGVERRQGGLRGTACRLAGGERWLLPLAPCRGGQSRGNLPSPRGWRGSQRLRL